MHGPRNIRGRILETAERTIKTARQKWDGIPDYQKGEYLACIGFFAFAVYFYNVGFDWGWKCGKSFEAEKKVDEFNCYVNKLLNTYEMPEAFRQDVLAGKWPGISVVKNADK